MRSRRGASNPSSLLSDLRVEVPGNAGFPFSVWKAMSGAGGALLIDWRYSKCCEDLDGDEIFELVYI